MSGLPLKLRARRLAARLAGGQAGADVVFVLPPTPSQGWILDAICREVGARLTGWSVGYCGHGEPLPPARRYFFSHYMYFVETLAKSWRMHRATNHVFATHLEPDKHRIDSATLAGLLAASDSVVCMNRALAATLGALGVPEAKLKVVVGAADQRIYSPHPRADDGSIGFCSAYYERKSPGLVLEIAQRLPHRRVVLLGKGWRAYPRFAEMTALPNFSYVEASYADYPAHYGRMSVFVSASRLEGGPIPLLEAMMCNAVPVASRTGFAPDVIEHGRNGFLFDTDAKAEAVCSLIEQAYALRGDVSHTVQHCDWEVYAQNLRRAIEGPAARRPATGG
jgi:glycosyltransferase involved in cell wall biosynthesis